MFEQDLLFEIRQLVHGGFDFDERAHMPGNWRGKYSRSRLSSAFSETSLFLTWGFGLAFTTPKPFQLQSIAHTFRNFRV
jgi:hypothetical protein